MGEDFQERMMAKNDTKDVSLLMQDIAEEVDKKLPEGFGFFVFVYPFGDVKGRVNYVSNGNREDCIKSMKEFIIRAGHEEDWMKHIN